MDRLKKFFINGILMTFVALVMRYLGVKFNVYISNQIGAVSMGLFTLISSVYGFALTLATSGISLATTKLVSEAMGKMEKEKAENCTGTIGAIMKKSIFFSLGISFAVATGLFLFADSIGTKILNDARTVSSLKILAISLPSIAISSSFGGYFTAVRRVYKNAIIQIFSQLLRIALCILLLTSVFAKDMESACIAIVLGMVISEMSAFILHAILFLYDRQREKKLSKKVYATDKRHAKKLLSITIPVALSAYMRSALVTVEHLLIPWGLQRSGSSKDISLAAYGTLHSIVFPLVLFPSAISSSFAGLLIPEISESNASEDKKRIDRIISKVLKTVLLYSICVCAIMMSLSTEIGTVLLSNSDTVKYIALISPLIPIMYLDTSVDSILKGLGYQFYSMVINIIDASMSVVLVWLLLPRVGIMGYVLTVYFTELLNAALSITKLLIVTKTKIKLFDWIAKPIICAIISTGLESFVLKKILPFSQSKASLCFHIIFVICTYFLLLIVFKAISRKEIKRSIINFIKA